MIVVAGAVFAHRYGAYRHSLSRFPKDLINLIVRFTAHNVRRVGRAQFILRKRRNSARTTIFAFLSLALWLVVWCRVGEAQVAGPPPATAAPVTVAPGMRHVQIFPRSDLTQLQSFPNPATGERIVVWTGGVSIVIDGLPKQVGQFTFSGSIDITADRVVVWTTDNQLESGQSTQPANAPLELYMEGNVVFREADRSIPSEGILLQRPNV